MGTKQTNSGPNDHVEPEVNDFDAIAKAIAEGKEDELSRLMAAEENPEDNKESPEVSENEDESAESDDTDTEDTDEESESDNKSESKVNKGEEVPASGADTKDNKEAANPAASTANAELEDLKTKLHRAQSDAGRVPYLQRQLAELQRQLRAEKARATEDATRGKKSSTSVEDVELDEETQQSINDLKEIDPVLAKTLERGIKAALTAANRKVDHVVTTFTEEDQRAADEAFISEQIGILAQRVPQYQQIFASPEWRAWKDTLTPGERALAESSYANEVEKAIYAFAAEMQRVHGQPQQTQQTPPAAPSKPVEEATPPVKQEKNPVTEARERRMATAAEAKSPAAKQTKELDDKAVFEEFYNQIRKENHLL